MLFTIYTNGANGNFSFEEYNDNNELPFHEGKPSMPYNDQIILKFNDNTYDCVKQISSNGNYLLSYKQKDPFKDTNLEGYYDIKDNVSMLSEKEKKEKTKEEMTKCIKNHTDYKKSQSTNIVSFIKNITKSNNEKTNKNKNEFYSRLSCNKTQLIWIKYVKNKNKIFCTYSKLNSNNNPDDGTEWIILY